MESSVASTDLVVECHACLERIGLDELAVDGAPMKVCEKFGSGALLFSPAMLPLESLESCIRWQMKGELRFFLKRGLSDELCIPDELLSCIHPVMDGLTTASASGYLEVKVGGPDFSLLEILRGAQLVECASNTGSRSEWCLTELGRESVVVGQVLQKAGSVSLPRTGVGLADFTLWELSEALRTRGWSFTVIAKDTKSASLVPFRRGGRRHWYCHHSTLTAGGSVAVPRSYLMCLLRIDDGDLECTGLPHLKGEGYYAAVLDGRDPRDRPAKKRRTRSDVSGE